MAKKSNNLVKKGRVGIGMRTITLNVYDINEMRDKFPEQYEKIIERFDQINVDYDWWDFIFEDLNEDLEKYGMSLDDKHTTFNIGYPYDDFTLRVNVDDAMKLLEYVKKEYPESFIEAYNEAIKIAMQEAECGETEADFEEDAMDILHDDIMEVYGSGSKDEGDTGICEEPSYLVEELQDKGFEDLKEHYWYSVSEEAIRETLEANEFEFFEDGRTV